MLCPECNHQLLPVSIKGAITDTTIDFCDHCHGIWTDEGETNYLDLKGLLTIKNGYPTDFNKEDMPEYACPKDRTRLARFNAESVPPDVYIFRCDKCRGNWFPRGSLFEFKQAQNSKLDYFKRWKIPLHSIYAVLLPVLVLVILGTGFWVTFFGIKQTQQTQTQAKDLISEPLILHSKPGTTLISFNTKESVTTKLKYWITEDQIEEIEISQTPDTNHTVTLNNLVIGQTYSIQLIVTSKTPPLVSPVHTLVAE